MDRSDPITLEDLVRRGLPEAEALDLLRRVEEATGSADATVRWSFVSRQLLDARHPDAVHAALFREVYRSWDGRRGPPPAWLPPADIRSRCNLGRLLDELGLASEADLRAWSVRDRAGFWAELVRILGIRFDRPYEAVVDLADGPERPRWFPGALLNIADSCFQAEPEAVALRQHSEGGDRREVTYRELDRLCNRVAGGLVAEGLAPGDSVGLLLPLTIEAVAALLGVIRAGCVAVCVAESFAPPEVARRLELGGARLVITQDAIHRRGSRLPLYAKLEHVGGHRAVVVPSADASPTALRPGDLSWDDFLSPRDDFAPVPRDPSARTIILFSSGTTGDPKAIPWDQTTPIKAASDGFLYQDIQPGDVFAWPTSMGWVMGPLTVFAALINRATLALFDGYPGTGEFCRFVEEARVDILGVVPSLVSAWKAHDHPAGHDWSRLKLFSSTGECSNPDDMLYLMGRAGYRPVIEYCGGTELGGGYIASSLLLPNAPSCFNTVAYGLELAILDEEGRPADLGEGFLIGPAVGFSTELIHRDHHATYYAGTPESAGSALRRHGDRIERLPGGFFRVLGRVDDTMNLGGIKVSAVEIERVLNGHPLVRESAAVAVQDGGGGPERLVAYIVPDRAVADARVFRQELQARLASELNPLFKISEVVVVESLPRTATNKVMRRMLRPGPA